MASEAEVGLCRGLCIYTCISNDVSCLIVTSASEEKITRESETWEYPQQTAGSGSRGHEGEGQQTPDQQTSEHDHPEGLWISCPRKAKLHSHQVPTQAPAVPLQIPFQPSEPFSPEFLQPQLSPTLPAGPTCSSSTRALSYLPQLGSRGGFGCTWCVSSLSC